MTLLGSTILIYFLLGAGVAVAVYLSDLARTPGQRGFQTAACVLFWPLFLPVLLQASRARARAITESVSPGDELARAIHQVEMDLRAALQTAGVSHNGETQFDALHARWMARAARIREMDQLLASLEYAVPNETIQSERPIVRDGASHPERLGGVSAMNTIVQRLREVRQRAHDDLTDSLGATRQLTAMLHLARFTGAPASRVAEIVQEIELVGERLDHARDSDGPIPCAADDTAARG